MNPPAALHVVAPIDENGEVREATKEGLEAEVWCLRDEVKGLQRDIRGWARRYCDLERDKEAEAEADPLWPIAVRIFKYHSTALNHPKAVWTWERFFMLKRHLKRKDGLESCLRVIAGARADSWRMEHKLTMFEDLFENQKKFERCLSRCPQNWEAPKGAMELLK